MHSSVITSLAAAALLPAAAATLDKPVIKPPFPNGGLGSLGPDLMSSLPIAAHTTTDWDADHLPRDCKTLAQGAGFSPLDVSAFDIHYDDCKAQPWVFCRHKDSPLSKTDMTELFGRLPVRMRQFIRHIIALPGQRSAGSAGDNIQMNGDCEITVFIHETGHSLDSHAFDPKLGVPFSNGKAWTDAYHKDTAVTDDYGRTSQQENFAQETVVSVYDKNVEGGIGKIQPNAQAIRNAYTTLETYIGNIIIPGGECTHRLENSPSVPKADSARTRLVARAEPVGEGLTRIEPVPFGPILSVRY
ncbi:Metallopeptidase, catalytic domain protein [Cordyceps fumosorosea ARSEF 2679]|uniref:Metallopeptidase, catalytic domain protein n=1 Tax=Cordyceps fumosorosea (strain ARSEF 2679) TaxID=1081104 RepID=A0A167SWY8_CORFA|nr:Metallopeptidase, catalytic domain protein [Cordyceps fumosorosea ARSEF 2679]OAA60014.1 Metallopeptidase, catalytic domain protein [Cordyceps fumosorosea ARSEF 2679]